MLSWVGDSAIGAIKPDLIVVAREESDERVRAALSELGFVDTPGTKVREYWGKIPEEERGLQFRLARNPSVGGRLRRGLTSDALVLLGEGLNHLRLEPNSDFRLRNWGEAYFDIFDFPNPFPWTTPAAARVMQNLTGERKTLSFKTNATAHPLHLDLRLPSNEEGLTDYLQTRGLNGQLSRAGLWAQGLLARLNSLADLDVLATDDAVLLLDSLSPLSRKKTVQRMSAELRTLLGEQAPSEAQVESLILDNVILLELRARRMTDLASGGRRPHDLLPVMEGLVESGFVYRGHMPECPNCGYEQFRELSTLDERIECSACRTPFLLPVSDGRGQEPQLCYRLDGLMGRVMDQDLLPVLLSLRLLFTPTESPLSAAYWPGLEISADGYAREVDLLLAVDGVLTAVECKRQASNVSTSDVERLVEVATRLSANPILATLEGALSDEVQAMAAERALRLLGSSDLIASA